MVKFVKKKLFFETFILPSTILFIAFLQYTVGFLRHLNQNK